MRLDGLHERAITRPLLHDELLLLHSVAMQARLAVDLAGQRDDLARTARQQSRSPGGILRRGNPVSLTIKALFKLPLRQTTGMVARLLKLAGLDCTAPDYSTPCPRQETLVVQIPYRRADGPVNLLVDDTGIRFLGDSDWQALRISFRAVTNRCPTTVCLQTVKGAQGAPCHGVGHV